MFFEKYKLYYAAFFIFCFHSFPSFTSEANVKVAVVHFRPYCKEKQNNVASLLQLAEEAGCNEAKIVVFPELATSGYSFFSREQIRKVAETIPGPTTDLFSEVATRYGMYIILGLPEYEAATNLFYNSAVLITPEGSVGGVYRKHSHLMEASWSSSGTGKVPVFDTHFGKLAILICADINYSELSTQAALEGARFLILPTNGGGENTDLLKVRSLEGNYHIILSNRFGNEKEEYLNLENPEFFNEETFTLVPPFYYDFQGSQSCVVDSKGEIRVLLENPWNEIGYCHLSLENENTKKILRRPELYAFLQHNTLDSYSLKCMNLPPPNRFLFAAFHLKSNTPEKVLFHIREVFEKIRKYDLNLVVFPANVSKISSEDVKELLSSLKSLAHEFNLDFVMGMTITDGDRSSPVSYMITKDQKFFCYKRLHKLPDETIETGDHFFVIDREYGRVAMLQDKDLFVPETTKVLGKMGVDIVAVSGDEEDHLISTFCKVRSSDYLHILMANQNGFCGIYAGGFRTYPSFQEHQNGIIMELDTHHVREKKELKIEIDPYLILRKAS